MKKTGKIVHNDNLVRDIYKMTFDMGECDFRLPGQYAMIEAGGVRRPYQVCDFDSNRFTGGERRIRIGIKLVIHTSALARQVGEYYDSSYGKHQRRDRAAAQTSAFPAEIPRHQIVRARKARRKEAFVSLP